MIFDGDRLSMSELSQAVKRKIKRVEKSLEKKCMKVWYFTNRLDERFIFGRFGKLRDNQHTIVTLAAYSKIIYRFLTI